MGRKPKDIRAIIHKKVFTSGEVAKVLHVSQMTVIKWFNEDKLHGYRVPYSKDRRVTRDSLIQFIKENNLPIPELLGLQKRILVVDDDPGMRNAIEVIFEDQPDYKVDHASTGYEAGLMLARLEPDLLILDIMLTDMDARELVKRIRADVGLKHSKIIGISAFFKKSDADELREIGFNEFLPKPFTSSDLISLIQSLLDY